MFKSATVKLTAIYVAILLVICLLFSTLLYRVLAAELDRNHDRQTAFFANRPRYEDVARDNDVLKFLDNQVEGGKRRILGELLYINSALLLAGGIASYFLARRTLEPIEEAHAAQARFTADASHELRTPLATMQTEIEVALRDPKLKLSESKELLNSNLDEISTLRQLVGGLLTLARGQEIGATTVTASLADAIDTALIRTKKAALKQEITISTKVAKDVRVKVEQSHITEVLVILLDNAIKYSQPKQTIELVAHRNQGLMSILIKDTGIGIAQKDLDHVFERFYRADNARSKTNTAGHGLGLSIAKQLVEQYGGSLSIMSKQGSGTIATITVPLA